MDTIDKFNKQKMNYLFKHGYIRRYIHYFGELSFCKEGMPIIPDFVVDKLSFRKLKEIIKEVK